MSSWHPCRALFWYLLGIIKCRVFLSSLDGVTHLYRTPLIAPNGYIVADIASGFVHPANNTLHPFGLFLLIRYLIFLITGSWHWDIIQYFCDMAFGSSYLSKVSVTYMLQEYASIKVVPCVTSELSAWTVSTSRC